MMTTQEILSLAKLGAMEMATTARKMNNFDLHDLYYKRIEEIILYQEAQEEFDEANGEQELWANR